jgi:hypothetical protein
MASREELLGIVSGLTLLASAALVEIGRLSGQDRAGLEWLRREALRLEE